MNLKTIKTLGLILLIGLAFTGRLDANPIRDEFEKGMDSFNQQNFKTAIVHFENVIKMYPGLAASYLYLGLAHKENGAEPSEVMWLLKKAIEVDPEYAQAYENLGKHLYSMGRFDEALGYAQKAVDLDPDLISGQLSLAWIYMVGKNDPEKAIPCFEKALEHTQSTYIYFGLGMAYYMSGERLLVMDMITKLRLAKEEDLAVQLEGMIKSGEYNPKNFQAVASQNSGVGSSRMVRNVPKSATESRFDEQKYQNMPVRLSSPPVAQNQPSPSQDEGSERIRALRRQQSINVH